MLRCPSLHLSVAWEEAAVNQATATTPPEDLYAARESIVVAGVEGSLRQSACGSAKARPGSRVWRRWEGHRAVRRTGHPCGTRPWWRAEGPPAHGPRVAYGRQDGRRVRAGVSRVNGGRNILCLLTGCGVAGRVARSACGSSGQIAIPSILRTITGQRVPAEGSGHSAETRRGGAGAAGRHTLDHQETKDATSRITILRIPGRRFRRPSRRRPRWCAPRGAASGPGSPAESRRAGRWTPGRCRSPPRLTGWRP